MVLLYIVQISFRLTKKLNKSIEILLENTYKVLDFFSASFFIKNFLRFFIRTL